MFNVYIIPAWFFNYSVLLESLFFLVTLFVGIFALKIYKLSSNNQSKLFGISFIFIALSYVFGIITNIIFIYKIRNLQPIGIFTYTHLTNLASYVHMLLFITGLVTLVYMSLNIKNFRIFSLLFALSITPLTITSSKIATFQIFSSLLLMYIAGHYLLRYIEEENKKNLSITLSFVLLLIVNIVLIFSTKAEIYYVVADIISLCAYALILIKLIKINKK